MFGQQTLKNDNSISVIEMPENNEQIDTIFQINGRFIANDFN